MQLTYDNSALLKVDYTTVLETHWLFSNSKMTMIYNYSFKAYQHILKLLRNRQSSNAVHSLSFQFILKIPFIPTCNLDFVGHDFH